MNGIKNNRQFVSLISGNTKKFKPLNTDRLSQTKKANFKEAIDKAASSTTDQFISNNNSDLNRLQRLINGIKV